MLDSKGGGGEGEGHEEEEEEDGEGEEEQEKKEEEEEEEEESVSFVRSFSVVGVVPGTGYKSTGEILREKEEHTKNKMGVLSVHTSDTCHAIQIAPHAALHERSHVSDLVLQLVHQLQEGRGMTDRVTPHCVGCTNPALAGRQTKNPKNTGCELGRGGIEAGREGGG